MQKLLFLFCAFFVQVSLAQVTEEVVQLDTSSITLQVIYRQSTEGYYFKKIAVYANDTNKIAIEKMFTNYGQNGVAKVFYPSGETMVSAIYANNKKNGEWTWYYENGIIKVKGVYQEGVKHGFWAYKYIKTYGKYKYGKKTGKWKFYDKNGIKHISHFKNGEYIKGETGATKKSNTTSPLAHKKELFPIDSNYYSVIHHISKNYLFRKKFKYFYGASKKERTALDKHFNYGQDYFKFRIAPLEVPLHLSPFSEYVNQKKIIDIKVDSILAYLEKQPSSLEKDAFTANMGLYHQSTDTLAEIIIYFSKIRNNLIKVELFKCVLPDKNLDYATFYKENNCKKWSILYYLDQKNNILGIEYDQPQ